MSDFLIGLDLDGVCYNFERTARYMIRRRMEVRGETPPPELSEPSRNWDWIKDHSPERDWAWLWKDGVREGLFRYGHVIPGAVEGVRELNEIGDVVAITARPQDAVHDTLAWLAMFFDKAPLSGIVIQSFGQKKSEVRPLPDVYIDDGTHNLEDVLENTESSVVQFLQPWNENWRPPHGREVRHFHASGWAQTVTVVQWVKDGRK